MATLFENIVAKALRESVYNNDNKADILSEMTDTLVHKYDIKLDGKPCKDSIRMTKKLTSVIRELVEDYGGIPETKTRINRLGHFIADWLEDMDYGIYASEEPDFDEVNFKLIPAVYKMTDEEIVAFTDGGKRTHITNKPQLKNQLSRALINAASLLNSIGQEKYANQAEGAANAETDGQTIGYTLCTIRHLKELARDWRYAKSLPAINAFIDYLGKALTPYVHAAQVEHAA